MSSIALLSGVIIGMIGTGLVFVDTVRRDLPVWTRFLWTGGVGVISIGGAVGLYVFNDILFQLYFRLTQTPIVVQSPRELAAVLISIGFGISAAAVLVYGFGSRFGPLKAA